MFERKTLVGKILRFPLDLIPSDSVVRILRGPLRGMKWVVGAGVHGYWTGNYEEKQLRRFASAINPDDCIYDVGANVGLYSLLACVKAGPLGRVYSFEPLERNLQYLRRHVSMNRLHQCFIKEVAVSDRSGIVRFSAAGWSSSMGRITTDGELHVPALSLDDAVFGKSSLTPPNVIKIDVEGAEFRVLQGAARVLGEFHPSLFVEIHGVQERKDCHEFIAAKGYHLLDEYGSITAIWSS
jgi:FkbM family methyltransferase